MNCAFISCFFTEVSATINHYILRLESSKSGFIDRCCFYNGTSSYIYGCGVDSGWCLPSASINSTVCTQCLSFSAQYFGGSDEFTHFHNNHSHLTATSARSCYCQHRTPAGRDDINCFFFGVSCVGTNPVDLRSDISNSIVSRFNFVNNTDSSGYFYIFYTNVISVLRDSVIFFRSSSTSLRWLYNYGSGTSLVIQDSYVVASGTIPQDSMVSISNVPVVESASTFKYFIDQPMFKQCNPGTYIFSSSGLLLLISPFFQACFFFLLTS